MRQYGCGYLNLKTLREQENRALRDSFTAVLERMPSRIQMVTLDLALEPFTDEESAALVEVIQEQWPRTAFCLARCVNPICWMRPAATFSQPLLAWRAPVRQGGYLVLGRQVIGEQATILRALCYRYEWGTAERLANDPEIISPHKTNFDTHSLLEWATREKHLFGPTLADVSRIGNELQIMAERRYILHQVGMYRAIHPVSPIQAFVLHSGEGPIA